MSIPSKDRVYDILQELSDDLCNSDETICALIAESNACGWGPDVCEIRALEKIGDNKYHFRADMHWAADDEDGEAAGTQISAQISGTLVNEGELQLGPYELSDCRLQ